MMASRRQLEFKPEDYKIIEPLTYDRSVFFVEEQKSAKRFLMKIIDLGAVNMQIVTEIVQKLMKNSHPNVLKPEYVCRRFERDSLKLYLLQPRLPLSLQRILAVHKSQAMPFAKETVEQFAETLYNLVCRLSQSNFYHGNLKPSNIFWKDNNWYVSECGLPSQKVSKYYAKNTQQTIMDKTKSLQYSLSDMRSLERDLHSLALILLEMMTLSRIEDLVTLMAGSKEQQAKYRKLCDEAAVNFSPELVQFAKSLFLPQEKYRMAYKRYKDSKGSQIHKNENHLEYYARTEYSLNLQELGSMRQAIKNQKQDAHKTLLSFKAYDPELEFCIPNASNLQKLLTQYYRLEFDFGKVLDIWQFYTHQSQFKYFNLILQIYPLSEVAKAVLVEATKMYDSEKEFFRTQTNKNVFWKVNMIKEFFSVMLESDIDLEDWRKVVHEWNKNPQHDYITFDDYVKIIGRDQDLSRSQKQIDMNQRNNINQIKRSDYDNFVEQLKNSVEEGGLFRFFRDFDSRNRWVVQYTIQKQFRKRIKMPADRLKGASEILWRDYGTASASREEQKLKYINFLKDTEYKGREVELFKNVLIEKINERDFKNYFEKYIKDRQGWTKESLLAINDDQQLEFIPIELNKVFADLDRDHSGVISQKELRERLTGLEEYSEEAYIESIKDNCKSRRIEVASVFFDQDKKHSLELDCVADLQEAMRVINIEMSKDHAEKMYEKYCSSYKFSYIEFLKQNFYQTTMQQLFRLATLFVMRHHYQNDFDEIYKLGLTGRTQKWSAKSLLQINDKLVLGFTQKEVEAIWILIDENSDVTLSKTEIAKWLRISYEAENYEEEDRGRKQGPRKKTPEEIVYDKQEQKISRKFTFDPTGDRQSPIEQPTPAKKQPTTLKQKILEQVEKNKVMYELYEKSKKRDLLEYFFDRDTDDRFSLALKQFELVLKDLRIDCTKIEASNSTKEFQFTSNDESRELRINYIKLILFLDTLVDNEPEKKSQTLLSLIRRYLRVKRLSIPDLLKNSRDKDKWSISGFELFLTKSLDSDIYYDDIEMVWEYWQVGKFLEKHQLEALLTEGKLPVRNTDEAPQRNKATPAPSGRSNSPERKKQQTGRYGSKKFEEVVYQQQQQYEPDLNQTANFRKNTDGFRRGHQEQEVRYETEQEPGPKRVDSEISFKKQPSNYIDTNLRGKPPLAKTSIARRDEERARTALIDKLKSQGLRELQRLSDALDQVDSRNFRDCLENKYRIERHSVDILVELLAPEGKVNLGNLRQLAGLRNSNSVPAADTRSTSNSRVLNNNSVSNNQLSTSQYIAGPKKVKVNVALVKEHIKIINSSFAKRKDPNEITAFVFQGANTITFDDFFYKCEDINKNVSRSILQQIFNYLNPVRGEISAVNFRVAFGKRDQAGGQNAQAIQFAPELEKQLKDIFNRADKDKGQSISRQEVGGLMTSLGLTVSAKDTEAFFKEIDTDGNNNISYQEFKQYIERAIFPMIANFEEVVDGISYQLRTADIFNTGSLEPQQFRGAMSRLGVSLTEDEIVTIFSELGRENRLGITDLIRSLSQLSNSKYRNEIRMILYKIKFLKKVTLRDIRNTFSKLSSCFSIANSYLTMRSMDLLPSTAMKPKLDASGLFFSDYFYTNINNVEYGKACLERVAKYNQLTLQIRLEEATGIPIPLETIVNRTNILRRHVNISLLDNVQEKIKDTMCEVEATWDPELEDVWVFNSDKGFDRSIYLKIGDYDENKFDAVTVLFEFVMTVLEGSQVLEINCGSSSLVLKEVSRLNASINKRLEVTGGIPTKRRFFKKQDILARRTGWRKIMQSDAQSIFKLEVVPAMKFREKLNLLDLLPLRIILNKSCLNLFRVFRQYFAQCSVNQGRINTAFVNDFRVKSFLAALDCRDIFTELVPYWNSIQSRSRNLLETENWFEAVLRQLHIVISNRDFRFLPSCPTLSSIGNKTLLATRSRLLKQALNNVTIMVDKLPAKRKLADGATYQPFRLHNHDEDPEDNIMAVLRRRARG